MTCATCGGRGGTYGGAGNWLRCSHCGGTGQVEVGSGRVISPMEETRDHSVTWDDKQKRYKIFMEFPFKDQGPSGQDLAELPALIAKGSWCSCGGPLTLGTNSVTKHGDATVVEAEYYCEKCADSGGSALSRLRGLVGGLWDQIGKVKISLTGLEIEKKGGHEGGPNKD